jgi:hypothetical protein
MLVLKKETKEKIKREIKRSILTKLAGFSEVSVFLQNNLTTKNLY